MAKCHGFQRRLIMLKLAMLGSAAIFASLSAGNPAVAFTTPVNFFESDTGIVQDIPTARPTLTFGSDGELPFDPFGAGFAFSDGIVLNANWVQTGGFNTWQQLTSTFTWVLPAVITRCGAESEPACEPVGQWTFGAGTGWQPQTPAAIFVWEPDHTTLSDRILLANNGPNGAATITFFSAPFIPEPSTWAMMLLGFAGLGFAGFRASRRRSPAIA
jgi:hypothetical protein